MTIPSQPCVDCAKQMAIQDDDEGYRQLSQHQQLELAERLQECVDSYFDSLEPA